MWHADVPPPPAPPFLQGPPPPPAPPLSPEPAHYSVGPGRGPRIGRLLAGVLLLVIAFGAGIAVGRVEGPLTGAPTATGSPGIARGTTAATPGSSGAAASAVPTGASPPPTGGVSGSPVPSFAGTIGPGASVPPFAPADFGLFWEALQLTQQRYVGRSEVDPRQLTYGAIRGMVEALGDVGHSVFLTPEELKQQDAALQGELVGIGATLSDETGQLLVVSVISGSPAAGAGVRSGDRILAVDDQSVEGKSVEDVVIRVRGEEGTTVRIRLLHRGDNQPTELSIVRAKITIPAVTWTIVPGTRVADLRVTQFSNGTTDQLKTAIDGARGAGATAAMLDLRGNPGGFVNEAVGVASQFLSGGIVYVTQDAAGAETQVPVQPGGVAIDLPLVVLVDHGSASSAEIVAGALQDAKRARLVGVKTFGTGTVLNTFTLSDGSAVRLGVERWLTPTGRRIFGEGVAPDDPVELSPDTFPLEPDQLKALAPEAVAGSGDAQLLKGLEILGQRP